MGDASIHQIETTVADKLQRLKPTSESWKTKLKNLYEPYLESIPKNRPQLLGPNTPGSNISLHILVHDQNRPGDWSCAQCWCTLLWLSTTPICVNYINPAINVNFAVIHDHLHYKWPLLPSQIPNMSASLLSQFLLLELLSTLEGTCWRWHSVMNHYRVGSPCCREVLLVLIGTCIKYTNKHMEVESNVTFASW